MRLTMVLQCRWRGGKAADQLQVKERARPQVDEREYQYEGGARSCGGEMAKLNRRSSTGAAVDVNNGAGSRGGDDEAQKRAAVNAMREKIDVQNSHLPPRSTGRAAHERWCMASVVRAVVAGGDRAPRPPTREGVRAMFKSSEGIDHPCCVWCLEVEGGCFVTALRNYDANFTHVRFIARGHDTAGDTQSQIGGWRTRQSAKTGKPSPVNCHPSLGREASALQWGA